MSVQFTHLLPHSLEGRGFVLFNNRDYIAAKRMTFEQYLETDTEGRAADWVNGEMRIYPSRSLAHQSLLVFLLSVVGGFVEAMDLGCVLSAGYAMRASPTGNTREPDLVFVKRENERRLTYSHLAGPADIAIEIISPESAGRDYVDKFREYCDAGVPEYWVIDSRSGMPNADFFRIEDGHYVRALPDTAGIYRSDTLPAFWLRLSWLWEDEPYGHAALKEILAGPPA